MKELRHHDALFIGNINAGVRNTLEESILLPNRFVQNPITTNDTRIYIRQQAIRDILFVTEFTEHLLVVIGDRIELNSSGFKFVESIAQLGSRLHALVDAALERPEEKVREVLAASGVEARVEAVEAGLEDVFVSVTRQRGVEA